LGGLPLGLNLFRRGEIPIGMTRTQKLANRFLINGEPPRLKIGLTWATNLWSFVPIDTKPAQPVQDWPQRLLDVPLLIRIVNSQDKLSPMASGK